MKNQISFNVFNSNHYFRCLSFVVTVLWLGLSPVHAEKDTSTEIETTPAPVGENDGANLKEVPAADKLLEVPADELLVKLSTLLQSIKTVKEVIRQQVQQLRIQQDNAKTVEDIEYYSAILADYVEQLRTLNKREEELKNHYENLKHQVECINGTALPETCQ